MPLSKGNKKDYYLRPFGSRCIEISSLFKTKYDFIPSVVLIYCEILNK